MIKKEIEINEEKKHKSDVIFSFENSNMNHLINKNAAQGLSRYMHREKKGMFGQHASLIQLASNMAGSPSESFRTHTKKVSMSPNRY